MLNLGQRMFGQISLENFVYIPKKKQKNKKKASFYSKTMQTKQN